jgi:hypothetical protein
MGGGGHEGLWKTEREIEIKMEREREMKVAVLHAREGFFSLSLISRSLPSSLSLPTFTGPLI